MANMNNRPGDHDYRQQNRWTEHNEGRGHDWDGDRRMESDRGRSNFERNREDYDWNYNQGGAGMGRGRRIWDQESGMYNQSPGYGGNTEAGRRGSEFYGGGSSYGGWGRGGYGQYDRGNFDTSGYDRGDFDRGTFDRGGWRSESRGVGRFRDIPFENQHQYSDYMSRGGGRFDEGTYSSGGRYGEGRFGAGDRYTEGMYSGGFGGYNAGMYGGRGYGDEGWFSDEGGYGRAGQGMGGGYGRMNAGYGQGPHAGRGPRGYKRSDDRIEEDVNEALTRHSMIDASDIEVKVEDREVTLKGQVGSRQEKRMAEDVAEDVSGVKDVHNELKVRNRFDRGDEHGSTVETGHSNTGGATVGNTYATATQH